MSILRGLRYPTALAFGLLLTGSIFWSLWSFTNVTFEISAVKTIPIHFTRTIFDTPVEQKNMEQVIEKPPIFPPTDIGGITDPEVTVVTRVVTPPLEPVDMDQPVLGAARDRDVAPRIRINPEYPARALARSIEGWVKVQFTISGTGAVTDVVVIESSPPNVFDDAAVKAVSRWRYDPKIERAVAVERAGVQTILRFDLEEE